jgi:hypothetical protein
MPVITTQSQNGASGYGMARDRSYRRLGNSVQVQACLIEETEKMTDLFLIASYSQGMSKPSEKILSLALVRTMPRTSGSSFTS